LIDMLAQSRLETPDVIFAGVLIRRDHRDFGVRFGLQNILRVKPALQLVGWIETDRPWEMLRVVPPRRPRRNEQLRNVLGVKVFLNGNIGRGADRTEHREHVVLLDKLAGLLDGFRRRIGIVQGQKLDFASVNAAFIVQHLKVGGLGARKRAVGRSGPAIGRGISQSDGGLGRAGTSGEYH
jgi:hypothetical protein